ncbi:hypothetical protein FKP32DRAFT_1593978 [Trametes sanguinea]|nr:hypothetical protein FKP32DRAFT_1593978 [Trametes sanguinea]
MSVEDGGSLSCEEDTWSSDEMLLDPARSQSSTPELPPGPDDGHGWSQGDTPPSLRRYFDQLESSARSPSPLPERLPLWSPTHEAELHRVLEGPQYAGEQPHSPCALLERFVPIFNIDHLLPLTADCTQADKDAARVFRAACWTAAEAHRQEGTWRTPVEAEQKGTVGIVLLGMFAVARAIVTRDREACRSQIDRMRILLDCMALLADLEADLVTDLLQ